LDLLAGFLPVDQEGLQAAMDRLLARIDDLGGQLIAPAEGMGLSPYLFTAIAAISAYQVAVRLRKPSSRQASFSTDAGASIATSFSHWSGSTQSM